MMLRGIRGTYVYVYVYVCVMSGYFKEFVKESVIENS